ncbi:Cif family virulence factor [Sphingomonas edaphi]|uniref:DUF4440 domain-containing protein n=1 Tax=Sphingomonas edaphi TaxID=2315689 RepID=A0A418Q3E9_9SPHN|nr:hypothetical protein [Sphingomonas edaphi]RIX32421.1 hypothetical protein D3M59_05635 [Sphingomonas edaphi]
MITAILLAGATPPTAIDAERAFAADAQEIGQWTAFRKYATDDALMFVPQPTKAQDFLKDRKDPPVSVFWWPGRSYVSCDGNTAVNTGPWVREWRKSVGYFTTVWQRQADGGWKWVYDAGDSLPAARAEGGDIKSRTAACPKAPIPPVMQPEAPADVKSSSGSSKDGTLNWSWTVSADGSRSFIAYLWDGQQHRVVVEDKVGPQ